MFQDKSGHIGKWPEAGEASSPVSEIGNRLLTALAVLALVAPVAPAVKGNRD